MKDANVDKLSKLLQPLGLYNRRAQSLKRFSEEWIEGFKSVDELYGIGQYAKDSWEIFQNNNIDITSTDKVLTKYLKIIKENT